MEGWGAFEGAGPDAPLTGSGWFLTPLVSVKREESVQGGRMGLAASPWSMKGSYSKATRVRSTLAWPPSGEAVDDAQHGGERSLTTRLDGRILLPADQFRPPLLTCGFVTNMRSRGGAASMRSSSVAILSRSALSKMAACYRREREIFSNTFM